MVYANIPHPEDGSPCPEHFRGYRDCGTCIQRGHTEGSHYQCDPNTCNAARDAANGYDFTGGQPVFRYEIMVVDQDGRLIFRDFHWGYVNGSSASAASTRVASDARFWFEKDQSVTAFYVASAAKDNMDEFAVAAYRRSEDDRWLYLGADMGPLDEVIRQGV